MVKNELTLIDHLRSFGIVEHVWVTVNQTIDRFFAAGFATGIDRPVTIGNGDDGIKLVFQNFHIAFFLRFESRYTPIIARIKFIVSVSLSQSSKRLAQRIKAAQIEKRKVQRVGRSPKS